MSATPPPRARGRAAPARARGRGGRAEVPVSPLVAAAQILLGATLSCLLAMLVMGALGAVVLLVLYITR